MIYVYDTGPKDFFHPYWHYEINPYPIIYFSPFPAPRKIVIQHESDDSSSENIPESMERADIAAVADKIIRDPSQLSKNERTALIQEIYETTYCTKDFQAGQLTGTSFKRISLTDISAVLEGATFFTVNKIADKIILGLPNDIFHRIVNVTCIVLEKGCQATANIENINANFEIRMLHPDAILTIKKALTINQAQPKVIPTPPPIPNRAQEIVHSPIVQPMKKKAPGCTLF